MHHKVITVHCGPGTQNLTWLAQVAIAQWDEKERLGFLSLGIPTNIVSAEKENLDMNGTINELLLSKSHVFIETSRLPPVA